MLPENVTVTQVSRVIEVEDLKLDVEDIIRLIGIGNSFTASTIISLFKKKYDMTVDTAWCWDLIERIGAFALIGWSEKMGDSWSIVQIARPEDLIVVKRKKMGASPMPMTREMLNGLSDKDEFEIIEIFELVD